MKMKESRGFTMIEMVVVLAVIAILAAILTPIVTSYVDRARTDTAMSDVKKIAAAIIQFNTDTKLWPIYNSTTGVPTNINTNYYDYECTAGTAAVTATGPGSDWPTLTDCTVPAPNTGGSTTHGDLNAVLNQNRMALPTIGKTAWKGAYTELGPDPWGTQYYVNTRYLVPSCLVTTHSNGTGTAGTCGTSGTPGAVYVISAGPNQMIDTGYDQSTSTFTVGNDDIVARIK
jgi:prepilin-type N-terminal cleavage/methylation domain-containing protein